MSAYSDVVASLAGAAFPPWIESPQAGANAIFAIESGDRVEKRKDGRLSPISLAFVTQVTDARAVPA